MFFLSKRLDRKFALFNEKMKGKTDLCNDFSYHFFYYSIIFLGSRTAYNV